MLYEQTKCSGITARLDTPYKFLTVDPPRSAPLRDQSLRWSSEGVLGTALPLVSSSRRSASSPPFGRTHLCSSPLRFRAFGQVPFGFGDGFATPLRFISRSQVPSATSKGGVPNKNPSRSDCSWVAEYSQILAVIAWAMH